MRLLDKFELLAGFGKFPVVILGNPSARDFELLDLERVPLEPNLEAAYKDRGLYFCGTFALIDGQGRCEFTELLDADMIAALAGAYAQLVIAKMREPADGADWLQALYNLPDNRQEMN